MCMYVIKEYASIYQDFIYFGGEGTGYKVFRRIGKNVCSPWRGTLYPWEEGVTQVALHPGSYGIYVFLDRRSAETLIQNRADSGWRTDCTKLVIRKVSWKTIMCFGYDGYGGFGTLEPVITVKECTLLPGPDIKVQ